MSLLILATNQNYLEKSWKFCMNDLQKPWISGWTTKETFFWGAGTLVLSFCFLMSEIWWDGNLTPIRSLLLMSIDPSVYSYRIEWNCVHVYIHVEQWRLTVSHVIWASRITYGNIAELFYSSWWIYFSKIIFYLQSIRITINDTTTIEWKL